VGSLSVARTAVSSANVAMVVVGEVGKSSRPVCLGVRHSSGTHDQMFISVKQLLVFVIGRPL
jgi:hypothetical protein